MKRIVTVFLSGMFLLLGFAVQPAFADGNSSASTAFDNGNSSISVINNPPPLMVTTHALARENANLLKELPPHVILGGISFQITVGADVNVNVCIKKVIANSHAIREVLGTDGKLQASYTKEVIRLACLTMVDGALRSKH